jgi:hypothetical protein
MEQKVTFLSADWLHVIAHVETALKNQRSLLEQPNNTFREKLLAIGAINALKAIQNLPNAPTAVPLKRII